MIRSVEFTESYLYQLDQLLRASHQVDLDKKNRYIAEKKEAAWKLKKVL
ncbi:hypothetical protein QP860_09750 [Aerococcus sp. UMB1112A]|nr:hypothetical protein [Aerococcus sp. UMB7533]MDK8503307.1 hypothetical protein [Aerococcus sp. UMB1112A]